MSRFVFVSFLILIASTSFAYDGENKRVRKYIDAIYYGSPEEQINAVHFFGAERNGAGLRPIIYLLDKASKGDINLKPDLVARMCGTIGRIGHADGNPYLIKLYNSASTRIELIKNGDESMKKQKAALSSTGIPKKDSVTFTPPDGPIFHTEMSELENQLEADGEFKIGVTAIMAIGQIDLPEGQQKLLTIAGNEKEFIEFRLAAIRAIRMTANRKPEFIEKVKVLLKSPHPWVVVNAAHTVLLLDRKDPEARKALIKTLGSHHYEVRRDAGYAMLEIPMSNFILPLEKAIAIEDDRRLMRILKEAEHRSVHATNCCHQP